MSYNYLVMGCWYDGLVGIFTVPCGGGTYTIRICYINPIYFANLYTTRVNVLV
jgi:hypothetical protein